MDEASNWRSAVDSSTGSTYYYHRKTRETTWVKPACLSLDTQPPQHPRPQQVEQLQETEDDEQESDDQGEVDDEHEDCGAEDEDEDEGGSPLDDFLVSLLSVCISTNPDVLISEDTSIVDKLVSIAASPNSQESHRRISLRCLWLLALGKAAPRIGFHVNQGWITLADNVHRWAEAGDFESGILYSSMISILLGTSAARAVIGPETVFTLTRWVEGLLEERTLLLMDLEAEMDGAYGTSIVNGRVLQALSKCTAGQTLSGLVLLLLAKQSFRRESSAVHFLRVGGLSALQSLCISGWIPADVRARARLVLESALDASPFVRHSLLNSFLNIASSVGLVALPSSQDPLCSCVGLTTADEGHSDDLWQSTEEDETANETFEIWRESTLPMQRDVDWKPKSGTSWHVSSVLLWTQCPELRATIEGLWEETGGELELGTNTSEFALASAVKYLHSGILYPPPSHDARVDLLKLASELGAQPLVIEAASCILHLMSPADVDSTLEISRVLGLGDLEKAARNFHATGKRPLITFLPENADAAAAAEGGAKVSSQKRSQRNASAFSPAAATDLSEHGDEDSNVNVVTSTGGGDSFRGTPSAKIKSGGIYGLLLEAGGHSSQPSQTRMLPGGSGSGAAKRIPGKVPSEPRSSRSAFGSSSSTGQKSKQSDVSVNTAKQAAGRNNAPAAKRGPLKGRDANSSAAAPSKSVAGESGLFEFDNRMSLAPEHKPTQREKRLAALSNPKPSSPSKKEDGNENDVSADLQQTKPPKRAQSPTLTGAGGKIKDDDASPLVQLDPNVRSSLILLKSRTFRRRRSVADVESDQQESQSSENVVADLPSQVSRPLEPRRASLRSLVSCTKRQGCTCADCVSSLSLSPHFEARAPHSRLSSFEPNEEEEIVVVGEAEEEDEEEHANEDFEDDVPSFRLEGRDNFTLSRGRNDPDGPVDQQQMEQCGHCGRVFNPAPYARHVKICAKVFLEKRKVFDAKEKRLGDLDLDKKKVEPIGRGRRIADAITSAAAEAQAKKRTLWKEQSQQFREAMRGAREFSDALAAGLPLPPPSTSTQPPAGYIKCPTCERSFSQVAGERHIPICATMKAKPTRLLAGGRGR